MAQKAGGGSFRGKRIPQIDPEVDNIARGPAIELYGPDGEPAPIEQALRVANSRPPP